ncbi:MAG: hypothetical protein KF678_00720 [Phycisphaeraceae bacterium]|nr:hypothetical protein [Phycisphaeraceae bacterium]
MTTVPTTRPGVPAMARPAAASPAAATAAPTVDPVKLVKKHKWLLLASVVAGMVVGTIAHYVWLNLYPIFTSVAMYECHPRNEKVTELSPVAPSKDELDKFMATQALVLTSDRIVDRTVADPALERDAPRWASQFKNRDGSLDAARAAKQLKKRLSVSIAGQSNLLRVSMWGTNPAETAAIVKLLCRTFERDRRLVGSQDISELKQFITQAITDTNEQIAKRQRDRQGILADVDADALTEQVSSVNRELEKTQTELVQVRLSIKSVTVLRDRYEEELRNPLGVKFDDDIREYVDKEPAITQLKQQVNLLESELLAMQSRLDRNHTDYRRLETRLEGTRQKLAAEVDRLCTQQFYARLDRYRTSLQSLAAQEETLIKSGEELRKRAVDLTQTLARVQDISNEIDRLTGTKAKLSADFKDLEILTASAKQVTRVTLFQEAQIPKVVTMPRLVIMIPAAAVLFFALTAGVVFLLEVVDQRVKGPGDIAMIPRTRLLGYLPHAAEDPAAPAKVETVFRDQPSGVMAENVRQLRGTLLKRMQAGGHKSLVCMSAMPGSGATSVAINMAFSLAAAEQKVLLIDANFRRPAVHRHLGLAEGPGLADVLSGGATLASAARDVGATNLAVMTAGSPDKRQYERLTSTAMSQLLKDAGAQYDIVLIDVAPAMVSGDATGLCNKADASMLVVRALGEKRGMVARLRTELSECRAEFLGVVVNAVRASAGGYLKGNILATHEYHGGSKNGEEAVKA